MGLFSSSPPISPNLRPLLQGTDGSTVLWSIRGPQKFLGLVSLGGFGLIARLSNKQLAVINPVKLSDVLLSEVQALQTETQAPLTTIYSPGDWHHLHLVSWSEAFPSAQVYVASSRNLKKQPTLTPTATVVDATQPSIPVLDDDFKILPVLGCQQNTWIPFGGDKKGDDRVEQVPLHKATGTLFITDHCFAPKQTIGVDPLTPNSGGFPKKDAALMASSVQQILDAQPRNIVFAHGNEETFFIQEDEKTSVSTMLQQCYEEYFLKQDEE